MSQPLVPKHITDKNGKHTTVRVKADDSKANTRVAKVVVPVNPKLDVYTLSAQITGISTRGASNKTITLTGNDVYGLAEEISYIREETIGEIQIDNIGKKHFGKNFRFDSSTRRDNESFVLMREYKAFIAELATVEIDKDVLTPSEAYEDSRHSFFSAAADNSYVPEADDAFEHAWDEGVDYGRRSALQAPTQPSGRGRKDYTPEEKAIAAAKFDSGISAQKYLGTRTLASTGNIIRDSYVVTGSQLVGCVNNILNTNRASLSEGELGKMVKTFLGDDWNDNIAELDKDRNIEHIVNVRDLRELFGEIAVSAK